MKNTKNRAALMVAAFIFLLPLSARSEIRIGSLEVTPFGGYNFFEDDQNLENTPLIGGRVGYNFTKHFGLEGVVEYMETSVDDRTIKGFKEGQYRSPMDDVDLTFYHIDVIYHFNPDGNFNPFVAVGFGGIRYDPDISTSDMPAFNVGVGAKYWLGENIAFRIDLRDYMVTEIFQESYHNVGVLAGLTFSFGGKEKPLPAPVAMYEEKPEPPAAKPVVAMKAEPKVVEKVTAPAPEPAPAPAPPVKERVIVLAMEDIHFGFDKAILTTEAKAILNRNIQILKENRQAEVRIEGYASAAGPEAYNQKLSERRAMAVKTYIVDEGGIAAGRLSIIGFGEKKPAVQEVTPEKVNSSAAKSNRRVHFEIIEK